MPRGATPALWVLFEALCLRRQPVSCVRGLLVRLRQGESKEEAPGAKMLFPVPQATTGHFPQMRRLLQIKRGDWQEFQEFHPDKPTPLAPQPFPNPRSLTPHHSLAAVNDSARCSPSFSSRHCQPHILFFPLAQKAVWCIPLCGLSCAISTSRHI